jgi:ferredoxin
MLSLSDGLDPHFRKAWFDPARCPSSCPRPCERVCPALAIGPPTPGGPGVVEDRCYGCGRCLPACPLGLIQERSQVLAPGAVAPLLAELRPEAIELHTQPGRLQAFGERLDQLMASGIPLRRLAVSAGAEVGVQELWQRFALIRAKGLLPIWQLDGRPMSGDVGDGMAHAAVRLLAQLAPQAPPGPLQLAGGTNGKTLAHLEAQPQLAQLAAGVAFGGVARRQLQPWLLAAQRRGTSLLADGELWPQALVAVQQLVRPWLERT